MEFVLRWNREFVLAKKAVWRTNSGVDLVAGESKMNATTLYVSTCRYILQAEHNDPNTWSDLYRRLPYLRQSLSCCVCAGLLKDPMGPSNSTCQHFVCRGCLGGKMLLKPSCSWCKDYSMFAEVKQLQILLSCYKKLCEYIADTPIARNLVGANGGTSNHSSGLSILQEGMAINDSHYERSRSQDISGFNIVEYLAKASMNSSSGAGGKSVQNGHDGHASGAVTPHHGHPEVSRNAQGVLNHTEALNGSEAEPYVSIDGSVDEYSVTITPNSDNSASPKIKIKRNKRLELGHHSQPKSNLHGLSIAKVKRKYQRRSKNLLLASNGLVDLHSLSNTPRKLVISGHRAKLLKAGRKLEIKEGCRCGTGSKYPGLNTCQGHRCPCFVSEVPCTKCRCKGCRNPLKSSEVGD